MSLEGHVDERLIEQVTGYVQQYMSRYDGSHDFHHIQRVLGLAKRIAAASPPENYDMQIVVLAALLHDVGDRKYLEAGQDATTMVKELLLRFGCSSEVAETVQTIVGGVSYSSEIKDIARVQDLICRYPELAVVQDADRLDAIGAVGIGRAFTFGGAMNRSTAAIKGSNTPGTGRGMEESIDHFDEKLVRLESMMKTAMGKQLARERTARLRAFQQWTKAHKDVPNTPNALTHLKHFTSSTASRMDRLPNELVTHILRFVDIPTLKDCRLVCHDIEQVAFPLLFSEFLAYMHTETRIYRGKTSEETRRYFVDWAGFWLGTTRIDCEKLTCDTVFLDIAYRLLNRRRAAARLNIHTISEMPGLEEYHPCVLKSAETSLLVILINTLPDSGIVGLVHW